MSLTVVGSIAFDSVRTPFGERERMLGGSAVHFALAAGFFTEVRVVGPVGDDFGDEHFELLRSRGVDVSGIEQVAGGETFFWRGHYEYDLNVAHTDDTQLNVFGEFDPKLSDASLSRFVDITPGGPRVLDGHLTVVPGHTVAPTPAGGWRVDPPGNLPLGEFTEYAADGTLTLQRINVVPKGRIKANNHLELYHEATGGAGGNPAGTWKLIRTDGDGLPLPGVGGKWFGHGLITTKGIPQGRIHLTTHSGVTGSI